MEWDEDYFNFLISSFEAGHASRTWSELKLVFRYPYDRKKLLASGFVLDGIADSVEIETDDWRDVEMTSPGEYAYFDRGWVMLTDAEIQLYRFELPWFPAELRKRLHLGGKLKEALPDTLWHLGSYKKHATETQVWLCRSLSGSAFDSVYEFFARYPEKKEGIILTQQKPVYKNVRLPGDFSLVRVDELINERGTCL